MAIVNELVREGLKAAFRWPNRTHMGTEKEIPARPMVAFLSPRARALLEHEDWTARTKPPGGGTGLGAPARSGVHVHEEWRKPSSKAEKRSHRSLLKNPPTGWCQEASAYPGSCDATGKRERRWRDAASDCPRSVLQTLM